MREAFQVLEFRGDELDGEHIAATLCERGVGYRAAHLVSEKDERGRVRVMWIFLERVIEQVPSGLDEETWPYEE